MTVPYWFDHHTHEDTTLDRVVLAGADGIVVMAYRNTVDGVVKAARGVLRHAETSGGRVEVAVETSCRRPAGATFCPMGGASFAQALAELRGRLSAHRAWAGLMACRGPQSGGCPTPNVAFPPRQAVAELTRLVAPAGSSVPVVLNLSGQGSNSNRPC